MFSLLSGVCNQQFRELWGHFEKEKISTQTWTWEKQLQYNKLFDFLQAREEEIRAGVTDG